MENRRKKRSRKQSPQPAPPISRRTLWIFRAFILCSPLVLLLLLEMVLRLAGYGYNPDFFAERIGPDGQRYLSNSETFSLRFFPPKLARWPGSFNIAGEKPAGVKRIFIFGESAAMGDPQPAYGASRFLEVLLRERFPEQKFEVINLGITAIDSHVILPIAREVAARGHGDFWIVYMGNNEMVGPFGAATVFGSRAPPLWAARINLAIQKWRAGQLAMALLRKASGKSRGDGAWGGMAMFMQNQIAPHDPRREMVYRNFEGNLRDILQAGDQSGAQIILSTMAVNLRDCPPFASLLDSNRPAGDLAQFRDLYNAALEFELQSNYTAATQDFAQASRLNPDFAETHFRWGECLAALHQPQVAKDQFQLACDDDALSFRADSRINAVIRKLGQDSHNGRVFLCDAEATLNSASAAGVAGDDFFFEHVHFNFDGNYRLALSWAEQVQRAMTNQPRVALAKDWASPEECERQLGLTAFGRVAVLQTVLQRMDQPPLNAQFNNPQRRENLKSQETVWQAQLHQPDANAQTRELLQAALAKSPNDQYLCQGMGNFLESIKDYSGAADAYRRSLALLPQDFYSLWRLGHVLALLGQFPEADKLLMQAAALRPYLPDAWFELASSQMLAGDYAVALPNFDRACELQPNDPKSQYHRCRCRGKLFAAQNRPADALAQYRQAIGFMPEHWEAHFELGGALNAANQLPEAAKEFGEAARLNPNYARTHFNYGVVLAKLNRFDDAQRELETTIRLDPGYQTAHDYLAQIQNLRRQYPPNSP
jgi:tetratricopeptide (TPR) repeat protein